MVLNRSGQSILMQKYRAFPLTEAPVDKRSLQVGHLSIILDIPFKK